MGKCPKCVELSDEEGRIVDDYNTTLSKLQGLERDLRRVRASHECHDVVTHEGDEEKEGAAQPS